MKTQNNFNLPARPACSTQARGAMDATQTGSKTMTLSFKTTNKELIVISKIAKRAAGLGIASDLLSCEMDLSACHANGIPLDFQKLLDFPDFDFAHDVAGVARHIDRETGKVMDCFIPRCAV